MHVTIINGSPRVKQFSNTDKIIESFGKGLADTGATYDLYTLSSRKEWEAAREAFMSSDKIIIALPLYVESAPGLLLEFLETLPTKREKPAELSFILQSGFAEGCQLRCGEQFLASLPEQLGCSFGGCLLRGDNFGIRLLEGKQRDRILNPYIAMGRSYGEHGNFLTKEAKKFVGPEKFSWFVKLIIKVVFWTSSKKMFEKTVKEWGGTLPLEAQPY